MLMFRKLDTLGMILDNEQHCFGGGGQGREANTRLEAELYPQAWKFLNSFVQDWGFRHLYDTPLFLNFREFFDNMHNI